MLNFYYFTTKLLNVKGNKNNCFPEVNPVSSDQELGENQGAQGIKAGTPAKAGVRASMGGAGLIRQDKAGIRPPEWSDLLEWRTW